MGTCVAQLAKCPTWVQVMHDLTVYEFDLRVGLCADSLEAVACFRFCVSLSLCPFPAHVLSVSLKNK